MFHVFRLVTTFPLLPFLPPTDVFFNLVFVIVFEGYKTILGKNRSLTLSLIASYNCCPFSEDLTNGSIYCVLLPV